MTRQWETRQFSKGQIDSAGQSLAVGALSAEERASALEVLGNWRSAHSFPLNTFQVGLRHYSSQVSKDFIVAQRLKRVTSIIAKLQRFPGMQLSRMQDLGGCRSVLNSIREAERLVDVYKKSSIRHELVGEKNYIVNPKESGYRGIHLIYKYVSDRTPTYNGLRIEIQLRSRVQHAWATAVETVGTFLQQSLKSSEGSEQWLEFFILASAAFAVLEKSPAVPNAPSNPKDLKRDLARLAKSLDVATRLDQFRNALQEIETKATATAKYFLLSLQPGTLTLESFRSEELERATERYLEIEQTTEFADTVLVAADSVEALRRAYPNYFLDTQVFLRTLNRVLR